MHMARSRVHVPILRRLRLLCTPGSEGLALLHHRDICGVDALGGGWTRHGLTELHASGGGRYEAACRAFSYTYGLGRAHTPWMSHSLRRDLCYTLPLIPTQGMRHSWRVAAPTLGGTQPSLWFKAPCLRSV